MACAPIIRDNPCCTRLLLVEDALSLECAQHEATQNIRPWQGKTSGVGGRQNRAAQHEQQYSTKVSALAPNLPVVSWH